MIKEMIQQRFDMFKSFGRTNPVDLMLLEHATPVVGTGNKGGKYMTIKECFKNALTYASHNRLRYAEGYITSARLPITIEHAWVLDADGGVIDPTLRKSKGTEYMGVTMEPQQAWDMIFDRGRKFPDRGDYYGVLFTGWGINLDAVETLYPEYKGRQWLEKSA